MTHKDFFAVVSYWDGIDKEEILRFLDGEIVSNEILLVKWFALWKQGNNRPIFDEIAILNAEFLSVRKTDTTKVKPQDHDMPRIPANDNLNNYQESKTRKHKFVS